MLVSHDAGSDLARVGPRAARGDGGRGRRVATPTCSPTRPETGSSSRATAGVFWTALAVELPEIESARAQGILNSPRATITARAADHHALDLLRRPLDAGVQLRGPADLDPLDDLDLLAERDPPVAGEVDRERARRRAGRGVLVDPVAGTKTRDFQWPSSRAKQLTPALTSRPSAAKFGSSATDLGGRAQLDVDVRRAEIVELDAEAPSARSRARPSSSAARRTAPRPEPAAPSSRSGSRRPRARARPG